MINFHQPVYTWYAVNGRELPWRGQKDPYLIWISEVILQQTRIVQGLPYYQRFIKRFPTIAALANATDDELLKMWQGLGYYSRALNLHEAARSILINYEGKFPVTYDAIIKLKGIGEYTAAAIASIAFGLPYAVVDGNVTRVLSRYFNINEPIDTTKGRKVFKELAQELLLESIPFSQDPGTHNQAVMEFGALQCVPKNPDCHACPLMETCIACNNKVVDKLPVKSKSVQISTRYFIFILIETGDSIFIEKRNSKDIWKNLYQLPLIETAKHTGKSAILSLPEIEGIINLKGNLLREISSEVVQMLTHRKIIARFVHIIAENLSPVNSKYIKVNKKEINKFAFPVIVTNYLRRKELV